jgi:predicted permease
LYSAKAAVARTSFDWVISIFMLATLPNTVIVGIPLLQPMYGEIALQGSICIISAQFLFWYNVCIVLFEVRAAALHLQIDSTGEDMQIFNVSCCSIRIVSRDNSCATSDATESYSPPSSEIASAAGPAATTAAFATKPELDLSQGLLATKKEIVVHDHVSKQTFISITTMQQAQKEGEEAAVTHHVGRDSTESSSTSTTLRHHHDQFESTTTCKLQEEIQQVKRAGTSPDQAPLVGRFSMLHHVLKRVLFRLLRQPILYGSVLGFTYSLLASR